MAELRDRCTLCGGTGEVECGCHRCRSPEGRACGVMGHFPEQCPECEGHGEVPVPCLGCGAPLDEDTMVVGFGGDSFCPACEAEYGRAA